MGCQITLTAHLKTVVRIGITIIIDSSRQKQRRLFKLTIFVMYGTVFALAFYCSLVVPDRQSSDLELVTSEFPLLTFALVEIPGYRRDLRAHVVSAAVRCHLAKTKVVFGFMHPGYFVTIHSILLFDLCCFNYFAV